MGCYDDITADGATVFLFPAAFLLNLQAKFEQDFGRHMISIVPALGLRCSNEAAYAGIRAPDSKNLTHGPGVAIVLACIQLVDSRPGDPL